MAIPKKLPQIVLGSTSIIKLTALCTACTELGITAELNWVKIPSGQNEQPIGFDATFKGAYKRANGVRKKHPHCIAIGIENGLLRSRVQKRSVSIDISVIVVLFKRKMITTTSEGICIPEKYVTKAEAYGFRTATVGSVIAAMHGSDPQDPHYFLTKFRQSREHFIEEALASALQLL